MILDTGFTGQSLLPKRYMRRLGLETDGYIDGRAIRIWQGRRRNVEVLQLDIEPRLGMELLWYHRITVDAVANGAVTVAPLSG